MTHKEKCQAALALFEWFQSQDMDEGDALDVMAVAFACIIGSTTDSAKHRKQGAEILKRQVLAMMAKTGG